MKRPTPWGPIMSMGAALLYGVSPIDLIPDLIPLLGIVDDAIVIPMVIIWSVATLIHRGRAGQAQAAPAYIDVPGQPVIPTDYEQATSR